MAPSFVPPGGSGGNNNTAIIIGVFIVVIIIAVYYYNSQQETTGCKTPGYDEYSSDFDIADSTKCVTPNIGGCMTSGYDAYNPQANVDDDSCGTTCIDNYTYTETDGCTEDPKCTEGGNVSFGLYLAELEGEVCGTECNTGWSHDGEKCISADGEEEEDDGRDLILGSTDEVSEEGYVGEYLIGKIFPSMTNIINTALTGAGGRKYQGGFYKNEDKIGAETFHNIEFVFNCRDKAKEEGKNAFTYKSRQYTGDESQQEDCVVFDIMPGAIRQEQDEISISRTTACTDEDAYFSNECVPDNKIDGHVTSQKQDAFDTWTGDIESEEECRQLAKDKGNNMYTYHTEDWPDEEYQKRCVYFNPVESSDMETAENSGNQVGNRTTACVDFTNSFDNKCTSSSYQQYTIRNKYIPQSMKTDETIIEGNTFVKQDCLRQAEIKDVNAFRYTYNSDDGNCKVFNITNFSESALDDTPASELSVIECTHPSAYLQGNCEEFVEGIYDNPTIKKDSIELCRQYAQDNEKNAFTYIETTNDNIPKRKDCTIFDINDYDPTYVINNDTTEGIITQCADPNNSMFHICNLMPRVEGTPIISAALESMSMKAQHKENNDGFLGQYLFGGVNDEYPNDGMFSEDVFWKKSLAKCREKAQEGSSSETMFTYNKNTTKCVRFTPMNLDFDIKEDWTNLGDKNIITQCIDPSTDMNVQFCSSEAQIAAAERAADPDYDPGEAITSSGVVQWTALMNSINDETTDERRGSFYEGGATIIVYDGLSNNPTSYTDFDDDSKAFITDFLEIVRPYAEAKHAYDDKYGPFVDNDYRVEDQEELGELLRNSNETFISVKEHYGGEDNFYTIEIYPRIMEIFKGTNWETDNTPPPTENPAYCDRSGEEGAGTTYCFFMDVQALGACDSSTDDYAVWNVPSLCNTTTSFSIPDKQGTLFI